MLQGSVLGPFKIILHKLIVHASLSAAVIKTNYLLFLKFTCSPIVMVLIYLLMKIFVMSDLKYLDQI